MFQVGVAEVSSVELCILKVGSLYFVRAVSTIVVRVRSRVRSIVIWVRSIVVRDGLGEAHLEADSSSSTPNECGALQITSRHLSPTQVFASPVHCADLCILGTVMTLYKSE